MAGKIRLGCVRCLRDDFDGIDEIPPDWIDVGRERSYKQACTPVPFGQSYNKYGDSVLDWETHSGICPDCQRPDDS